jgi:glycerol-3-phosphate cytidylyltransferase
MMSITFIIGVFDACHVGHVNLLTSCVEKSSRLTVGICSDALVEKTKGKCPLYGQNERAALLRTLSYVHDVIIYDDLDLSPWLERIKPTTWIVPPNYGKGEEIHVARSRGLKTAAELGIIVQTYGRTDGISTSDITERVIQRHEAAGSATGAGAIACDFHDTFTYHPNFFKALFKSWNGMKYLLTGDNDMDSVKASLYTEYDMVEGIDYDELLVCSEKAYDPTDPQHYEAVKMLKKQHIVDKQIEFYFDDNPIYCEYLRNFTCVFTVSLSDDYIRDFESIVKHTNVNFQHHVHDFIREDNSRWVASNFWKGCDAYPRFPHVKHRRQFELKYVLGKLEKQQYGSMMDVGCGDGALLKCLNNLIEFDIIYALDLSAALMKSIPNSTNIQKGLFDMNNVEEHSKLVDVDIVVFGGVLNYCFDDDVLVHLLMQFKNAKHVFIRAVCTLDVKNELILGDSKDLNKPYSSLYRTVDNTSKLIEKAGLSLVETTRLYPDEIESKFNTRQYMFYCTNSIFNSK